TFYSSPSYIRQILLNLVGNAIKFTENGTVGLRVCTQKGGKIRMYVTDTGVGMTAAQIEQAFDEYTRFAHSVRSQGSGLGLSITQTLCQSLGGNIVLTSNLGEGTVASVELPSGSNLPTQETADKTPTPG
ncbi:MAG: sensor histidine kinase, partial [Nannocystaceae bacterium]